MEAGLWQRCSPHISLLLRRRRQQPEARAQCNPQWRQNNRQAMRLAMKEWLLRPWTCRWHVACSLRVSGCLMQLTQHCSSLHNILVAGKDHAVQSQLVPSVGSLRGIHSVQVQEDAATRRDNDGTAANAEQPAVQTGDAALVVAES